MKPILKICMIISSILFVAGIACIGIGIALGVTPAQLVYAGRYPGNPLIQPEQQPTLEVLPEPDMIQDEPADPPDSFKDPEPLSGTNVSGAEEYYEFRDIRSLDLDLSLCKLNIRQHAEDYISVEADNVQNYFRCRQEGYTLCLEDERPSSTKSNSMKNALRLTLYLPDQTWKEIEAEIEVGEITLDTLTADEIEIDNGVGNITIGTIKGTDLSICTGVGELLADFIQADKEAEIEVGTGNITLSQFDGTSLELECGVGNATITAAGREQDYNYTLDAGLGSISLNHHQQSSHDHHEDSHDGWEHHMDIHHGADRQISINCGLGNASLNFTEE